MKNKTLSAIITILSFMFCLCLESTALAAPAYPGMITVTEEGSGEQLQILNHGDEFFHFLTDTDQNVIVAFNGYYWYLREENGAYKLDSRVTGARGAGALVHAGSDGLREKLKALSLPQPRTFSRDVPSSLIGYVRDENDPAYGLAHPITDATMDAIDAPQIGQTCPLLVLHVTFNNVPAAFTDAQWHKRIFDDGVSNYYSTVSNGRFTYVPAPETWDNDPDDAYNGVNDGIVTVSLPINAPPWMPQGPNASYSAGILAGLYSGSNGKKYAIYNESSIFMYAMLAAEDLVDFAAFDQNSDGYLSPTEVAFTIIFSGLEASLLVNSSTPSVWAHSWYSNDLLYLPDGTVTGDRLTFTVDGKNPYKYTILGEAVMGTLENGIWSDADQSQYGTLCHELGHDLGLKDLYNTGNGHVNLNVFGLSLMAHGVYGHTPESSQMGSIPAHIDAYSKIFLGFYDAQTVTQTGNYPLYATEPASQYNILRLNTDDPNIYYLIENRRYTGYDRGLYAYYPEVVQKSGGIVVWRVNNDSVQLYWTENTLNNRADSYAIMPAFHGNNERQPFWGGDYYDLGNALLLPEANGVSLHFAPVSDEMMQVFVQFPASSAAEPSTVDLVTPDNSVALVGAEISANDALLVTKLSADSNDYQLLLQSADGQTVFGAYEISLASGQKQLTSGAYLRFYVGTANMGHAFTLLHKKIDGTVERLTAITDASGMLQFGPVYELSPFLLLRSADVTVPSLPLHAPPKTGDNASAGLLGAAMIWCALLGVWMLRRRTRRGA